jgi:hypothetical protein
MVPSAAGIIVKEEKLSTFPRQPSTAIYIIVKEGL